MERPRGGALMRSLFYNPAPLASLFFTDCHWYSRTDGILLTFDDSPQATTEKTLALLAKYSLRALFFCTGENAEDSPDILKEICAAGHSIGNHSFSHRNMRTMTEAEQYSELVRANESIAGITGSPPRWFRPPYGKLNGRLRENAAKLHMETVMWSLFTYDYKNDVKNVKLSYQYLRNNSIAVFHDNPGSAGILEQALEVFMETVQQNKFRILTPEACLLSK